MKLHLGCGPRFILGYVHVDVKPAPHVDLVCGVDRLVAVKDGSAEVVYACHVLEHFPRRVTRDVLKEWYRVLAWNGVLRVAVPDFEAIARVYLEGLWAPDTYGTPKKQKVPLEKVIGPLMGRQDDLYNVHYTVFDFDTLSRALDEVGFRDVRRYDWRTTEHASVDDFSQSYLPHMDKDKGTLISLNVEAVKR